MNFQQWQDAANLQNSVYQPFIEWMRNKGWTNMEISRCMDIEKHERKYWEACIRPPSKAEYQLDLINEYNK